MSRVVRVNFIQIIHLPATIFRSRGGSGQGENIVNIERFIILIFIRYCDANADSIKTVADAACICGIVGDAVRAGAMLARTAFRMHSCHGCCTSDAAAQAFDEWRRDAPIQQNAGAKREQTCAPLSITLPNHSPAAPGIRQTLLPASAQTRPACDLPATVRAPGRRPAVLRGLDSVGSSLRADRATPASLHSRRSR